MDGNIFFFQMHRAYGNEVGGNPKNDVVSNNMSVIWTGCFAVFSLARFVDSCLAMWTLV